MSRLDVIEARLRAAFAPLHLEVHDESHLHSRGLETHYKVVLASSCFEGLRPVARHQKVYALLQDEMAAGLHALALHLFTPAEWEASGVAPESPTCRGGSRHD
ncbi:MAG: BolA family protein [Moraxellaceae bacterium]